MPENDALQPVMCAGCNVLMQPDKDYPAILQCPKCGAIAIDMNLISGAEATKKIQEITQGLKQILKRNRRGGK